MPGIPAPLVAVDGHPEPCGPYNAPMFPEGFLPLLIADTRETAELQTLIRVEVPADYRAAYTTPGQYCKVAHPDHEKPGFFVIANAPGADHFEFLIKESSPLSATLRTLPVGHPLGVSAPAGKGFPLHFAEGRDVVLLAAGSGIAALRPIVQHLMRERDRYGRIRLIYGERTAERVAFRDEVPHWSGVVECHCVVSQGVPAEIVTRQGYVQDALKEVASDCAGTVAYICGMGPMVEACKQTFAELGGDPAALFTNY